MHNDVAHAGGDKQYFCITTETLRVSTSWIRQTTLTIKMRPNILLLLRLLMHLFSCRRNLVEIQCKTRLQRKRRLQAFRKSQRDNSMIGLSPLSTFPDGRSGRIWEASKSTDWWDNIVNNCYKLWRLGRCRQSCLYIGSRPNYE